MPNFRIYQLFLLTCLCIITGCSTVLFGIYGIKIPRQIDDKEIIQYSRKFKIPTADIYKLDTSYSTFLLSHDRTVYEDQMANHIQPLQVLYFDTNGNLLSYHIDCNAGGFPNLKWNRNQAFSTFPPKTQAPADSFLPFEKQMNFLIPLEQTLAFSKAGLDYVAIVYWSRFMGRQSRRLIHIVQENSKLANPGKLRIIYVNNDNFFGTLDVKKYEKL